MITDEKIQRRAARGARYLDRHVPDWHRKVKIKPLRLADGCNCVLGQLAVTEMKRLPSSWNYVAMKEHLHLKAVTALGFNAPRWGWDNPDHDWAVLTDAWRDEIRKRRRR